MANSQQQVLSFGNELFYHSHRNEQWKDPRFCHFLRGAAGRLLETGTVWIAPRYRYRQRSYHQHSIHFFPRTLHAENPGFTARRRENRWNRYRIKFIQITTDEKWPRD